MAQIVLVGIILLVLGGLVAVSETVARRSGDELRQVLRRGRR